MNNKPDFISLFLDSLKTDYSLGGIRYLIPYMFLGCIGIGFFIGFFIFPKISEDKISFFPMLAALVTAQGILVALSMQSSSIILNNISQGGFSIFLKERGLLTYYMLLIQLIQLINVTSLILLLIAGFSYFIKDSYFIYFQIVLSLAFGFLLYAIRWTWGTTVILRDLIYYRNMFDHLKEKEAEGVINFPKNTSL